MRFPRLFSSHRPDADELAARCAAADRLVAHRVADVAQAGERYVANPASGEAFAALEDAEELLFLAEWELRAARAGLERVRKRGMFARAHDARSRATGSWL